MGIALRKVLTAGTGSAGETTTSPQLSAGCHPQAVQGGGVKEGLMTKVSVKKAREEWGEHLVVASLGATKTSTLTSGEWSTTRPTAPV